MTKKSNLTVQMPHIWLRRDSLFVEQRYLKKNTLNKDSFETKRVIETWRRSWNLVMKFEELKGVRTLPPTPKIKYCRLVT